MLLKYTRIHTVSVFLVVFIFSALAQGKQVVGFSFDADDNLFNLPTEIRLFHKKTGKEKGVTTAQFAHVRKQVGKKGTPWEWYEVRGNRKTGSFRFFGDQIGDGKNYFLQDLKKAMKETPKHWKGPAFEAFVAAMKRPSTSAYTTIVTARGHEPETIRSAFLFLKEKGMIAHVPEAKNIWTVSNPTFAKRFEKNFGKKPPKGSAAGPSARKAAIMQEILTKISQQKLLAKTPLVLSPEGKQKGRYHLWGFSDDDFGNFKKAKKVIQKGLNEGKWGNIKISLFYTGLHDPTQKPHTVILRKGQSPRLNTAAEEKEEWLGILRTRTRTAD